MDNSTCTYSAVAFTGAPRRDKSDEMVQQDALDKIIDSMPAAGPSTAPKKQVTYDEFQQMLDWTPLFMRETPHTDEDDPVLQGLRSLMLDGDGDGGHS